MRTPNQHVTTRRFCHILETSKDYSTFLEKNFHWKLSYDQVLDVLETNSVHSVDALASPTLNPMLIK